MAALSGAIYEVRKRPKMGHASCGSDGDAAAALTGHMGLRLVALEIRHLVISMQVAKIKIRVSMRGRRNIYEDKHPPHVRTH